MELHSLIDTQIDRGTATNQVLVWNNTAQRFEVSVTLAGLTLTSPVINTPDINGGTVDAITSLTVANSVDIGNFTLTANGLTIDGTFTDGTASLVGGVMTGMTIDDNWAWTGATKTWDISDADKVIKMVGSGAVTFISSARNWIEMITATNIMNFGNTADNQTTNFLGTGLFTLNGNAKIDRLATATDAILTMDGSGNSPGTFRYESDNDLFLLDKDLSIAGDTFWTGEGTGLPYGSFWGNEVAFVSAGGTGTFFEIADGDITVGKVNLAAFQNNKEIAVTKAGCYLVTWSMSVKATGANKHIVGGIGVDAGGAGALTIQNDGRNHAVSTGNAEFGISGTAILDLSASSEVGLMATNETDGTNVTIEHVSLSVIQVGGT